MFPFTRYVLASLIAIFVAFSLAVSAHGAVTPKVVATDLANPWSIDWLDKDTALITERDGQLIQINMTTGSRTQIHGLPPVVASGQGGLFDVRVWRDHGITWLYLSLAGAHPDGGMGTELWRGQLRGDRIEALENLFRMQRGGNSGRHFGGRIALDATHVYLTIGDRGEPDRSQDLSDHAGSIIRLHLDGSIPADNPFISRANAQPEIFSYGHRNPQGADFHPDSGQLWTHEHGPQGGDEINRIERGRNYGWPVITYGRNYGLGTPIGEGTEKDGMEQPLLYWDPSIAPSGMAFYRGEAIPQWQNHWFIGALKAQTLVRLTETERGIRQAERLFRAEFGRIRDVREGPDGALYLLTDSGRGQLIRLSADD
jgi:aldose sugar dehydrogenase